MPKFGKSLLWRHLIWACNLGMGKIVHAQIQRRKNFCPSTTSNDKIRADCSDERRLWNHAAWSSSGDRTENFVAKTELENLREVVPTSRLDGAPHGKATASPDERTAIKIETLERRLDELAGQYAATSMELAMEIYRRVTGKAQQVLFLRDCFGKTPSEIAAELKISRSYLSRLHTQGRQEFSAASLPRGGVNPWRFCLWRPRTAFTQIFWKSKGDKWIFSLYRCDWQSEKTHISICNDKSLWIRFIIREKFFCGINRINPVCVESEGRTKKPQVWQTCGKFRNSNSLAIDKTKADVSNYARGNCRFEFW